MTEVIVFLIVGAIAIVSAALMLISQNAVHSALFLVLNFVCVAFFFLTLAAPFIALAQITVYAGAIMVLFLFVIMLLGAERVAPTVGPFRWLPRSAIGLALVFLVTVGVSVASGQINMQEPPPAAPQVRFIHAADTAPVDVYLNNQLTMEGVNFRDATGYVSLAPGEYGVTVFPAGADPATESPALLGDLVLMAGDTVSLVALGNGSSLQLVQMGDDLRPVPGDGARLTLLNGLPEAQAVNLVDPGTRFNPTSRSAEPTTLIGQAHFGETVEILVLEPVEGLTLQVVPADQPEAEPLVTYRDLSLETNTWNLLIVAPEQLVDGRERVVPLHIATRTQPLFGSPQQVAWVLFSDYLLPFQLVAILLLVAMIGAIVLTREELLREAKPRRPVVRRPLAGPRPATPTVSGNGGEQEQQPVSTPEAGG